MNKELKLINKPNFNFNCSLSASDAEVVVLRFFKLVLLLLMVDKEVACLDTGVIIKSIFFSSRCFLLLDEENGELKANRSDLLLYIIISCFIK